MSISICTNSSKQQKVYSVFKRKIDRKMKKRSDYLEIGDDNKSSSQIPDAGEVASGGGTLVRVIFYYIGMTLMFPYMMLITVTDFWNYKFRNTSQLWNASASDLTEKQTQFPGYIAITGNVPLALFVILTAIFGYKVKETIMNVISSCDHKSWSDSPQDQAVTVCRGYVPVLHRHPGAGQPQH